MGLDVHLIPKDRNYDYSIDNKLSRRFCNFLCGPDAYANCEFEQVQKLLNIDLNVLRRIPVNLEPDLSELEYHIYLAEEEANENKVKELQKAIEEERINWEKNYESINEGWIEITELEILVSKFKDKLTENPDYHKRIQYNLDWADYFHPQRMPMNNQYEKLSPEVAESVKYINNILVEDLQSVLDWVIEAKKRKFKFATFNYE